MSKITMEMLRKIGACKEGRDAFAEHFPDGASWDEVLAAATTPLHQDWLAWLGRCCPAGVPGATWEARLALQRDDEDRACLGWCCPAGVPGATWEARLAVQRDDCDRACLGRDCPAGVPGATWEVRLAVQRNDSDRACLEYCCPAGVTRAGNNRKERRQ